MRYRYLVLTRQVPQRSYAEVVAANIAEASQHGLVMLLLGEVEAEPDQRGEAGLDAPAS